MLTLLWILAACSPNVTIQPGVTPTPATPQVNVVTPTITAEPPRTLVVCLGSEPTSLYLYGAASMEMASVLEAIYDGPVDYYDYTFHPVLLEKLPSLADGDAVLKPLDVSTGNTVVDADGNLMTLVPGLRVRPAGCTKSDCAITYDGTTPLQMDQMVVTFKMKTGITWSDGMPLTAEDSVYSYVIAADPVTPVNRYGIERTASYRAVDEYTTEWVGLPGYLDNRYFTNFYPPLPRHVLAKYSNTELLTAEETTRTPLGWGPYVIEEWTAGDHITLRKNPNYYRAAEGLPKFDTLVFRFAGTNADAALNALTNGECDMVDQTALAQEPVADLIKAQANPKTRLVFSPGPVWEHLDFGIRPAAYDDGYDPAAGDRPDFFGDVRTRQAFAYCLDRQGAINALMGGQSAVPGSYLPSNHPLAAPDLAAYEFAPEKGAALLNAVGWLDDDNNPQTPRVAQGVAGVPDGTKFIIRYQTTTAPLRQLVSEKYAASLLQCGIEVQRTFSDAGELFGEGPAGSVFGRNFDVVHLSWETGQDNLCFLYQSWNIPAASNQWLGVNITGYSNPAYDQACQAARDLLPGEAGYQAAQFLPQQLFAQELPVIPLYLQVKAAAVRPDFCGFTYPPTNRSALWNIEVFDYGAGCGE